MLYIVNFDVVGCYRYDINDLSPVRGFRLSCSRHQPLYDFGIFDAVHRIESDN